MNDIVEQSRAAREKLATALSILQKPGASKLIDTVAGPVARAMGALHQIESSAGTTLKKDGPLARNAVREALAALQTAPKSDAGDQATEHIAGSLGLVHKLAEKAKDKSLGEPGQPSAPPPVSGLEKTQLATDKVVTPSYTVDHTSEKAEAPKEAKAPVLEKKENEEPAPAAPSGGFDATLTPQTEAPAKKQVAPLEATQASTSPVANAPEPAAGVDFQASKPDGRSTRTSKMAPAPDMGKPADALEVEANLGAHSPTNFYKGLSGNDVIDDGGLFVSTYGIPPLGRELWLSVHMPGGYQFEALAVVSWTRESGAGDAPPGFGCTFKSISKDARGLVYRYTRNREPLFYDAL